MAKFTKGLEGLEDEDDGMDDMSAQLAALSRGMGLGMEDNPEDKVSQADVDKVIRDTLAAVKAESSKKAARGGAGSRQTSAEEDGESPGPDLVAGNEFLQQGMKLVRVAVSQDTQGKYGAAAMSYSNALSKFASALDCRVPPSEDAKKSLLESMSGYLNRISDILCTFDPQPDVAKVPSTDGCIPYTKVSESRGAILQAMCKAGFGCLSRGVELRKRAKTSEEEGDKWTAFLLYSDAIDCFVAYMKEDPKGSSNKTVQKTVLDMLDKAEELKKEI